MPRTLIRKNPSNFKTLPLHVEATPDGLTYKPIGMPLNFSRCSSDAKPFSWATRSVSWSNWPTSGYRCV